MRTGETPRAITVAILAMGGEGGGVLADWIVSLGEHSGWYAQSTSVPGVAQRTGATIYYLELFPEAPARAAGKEPVLALMPVPGEVDVVLASELMEAGRAIERGLVTPDRTTLIASTNRVYSMSERTAMGDGRVDSEKLAGAAQAAAKTYIHGDFARLADETRSPISAVLFGALAASGALPFSRRQFEEAIRQGEVGVASSLAAFAAGFAAPAQTPEPTGVPDGSPRPRLGPRFGQRLGPRLAKAGARLQSGFPLAAHEILAAGIARLADYQDEAYATEYLDRLENVRELDQRHGDGGFRLLRETARHLALWMSYEDAIRVADLKIRRQRFERVHNEVRAEPGQIVEIHEFLHPGVQEFADIVPASLGRWLLRGWAGLFIGRLIGRFTGKGIVLQTTSVTGFLQLYALAALRRWRRKSLRFAIEHKRSAEWLAQVAALAPEDYALALEVAECPRLIKGYGATNTLGNRNFDAVMGAIPMLRSMPCPAAGAKKLRQAALADESGGKLAEALREVTA
ncbi:MAG TPA: indolepyruvate oxidoreductase subunit beta family protein [Candidatus Acidoferrales bacterium]|jgi:indolepyruvate ferredoxin oxidoreductase beta subunit|nr:indolepyruvate oxidoreductase subunit beta family protein [Candidatus Acidoferrales bacterium]